MKKPELCSGFLIVAQTYHSACNVRHFLQTGRAWRHRFTPMREPSDYDTLDLIENIMKLIWVKELVAHRADEAQLIEDATTELWRLADELGARLGVPVTAQ